jgi:hypothetical protein
MHFHSKLLFWQVFVCNINETLLQNDPVLKVHIIFLFLATQLALSAYSGGVRRIAVGGLLRGKQYATMTMMMIRLYFPLKVPSLRPEKKVVAALHNFTSSVSCRLYFPEFPVFTGIPAFLKFLFPGENVRKSRKKLLFLPNKHIQSSGYFFNYVCIFFS